MPSRFSFRVSGLVLVKPIQRRSPHDQQVHPPNLILLLICNAQKAVLRAFDPTCQNLGVFISRDGNQLSGLKTTKVKMIIQLLISVSFLTAILFAIQVNVPLNDRIPF